MIKFIKTAEIINSSCDKKDIVITRINGSDGVSIDQFYLNK